MNSILRLLSFIIYLFFGGCQGVHENTQIVQQCMMTCMQQLEYCKKNCFDNCPNCSYVSKIKTKENFDKYVYERKVEGKKVMRELNSYRDPLQCRKVTCDCLADNTICKQGCTGVILKKLQPVLYCA